MRRVVKTHPEALYLVLGQTHPVVRRQEGESYRESLVETVERFGLRNNVQFVDRYLDFPELVEYLQATDIYLTPYLNPVQIVSGTLAYAIGMGKAIVSTPISTPKNCSRTIVVRSYRSVMPIDRVRGHRIAR